MQIIYLQISRGLKSALVLLIIIFTAGEYSFSQERTITGTVSASDTRETLPGATVVIKGTTTGAVTDINGKYSMKIPGGKVILVYSFMGYTPKEVIVGAENTIDIVMEPTKTTLQEVVVVGYGTLRKSDLTGAVSTVKSDDLNKITNINPISNLQGKVAGVQITNTDGTPGQNPVVNIRGVGTFGNSQPIYVVDGVITADISYLNSADIESMSVLKDASATAIYGNRGANGVIMITTKAGKAGQEKTAFTITGEIGWQKVAHKINLLNGQQYASVINLFQPGTYNNIDLLPSTDWQNEIFHLAPVYNFQGSASGAGNTTQYYFGIGYFDQQGIINKSYYKRLTIKLDNTYGVTKFMKLGNNLTVTPFLQSIAPDVTYQAYRAQPVIPPFQPDGSYSPVPGVGNPLASIEYSTTKNTGVRAVGNLYAEISFLKDFVFKSSFGVDGQYIKGQSFSPAYFVSPTQFNTYSVLTKSWTDFFTWIWENTLSYKKDFGKHYIDVVGGFTTQNSTNEIIGNTGQNIIRDDPNFWYIQPTYVLDPSHNINNVGLINNRVTDLNNYFSMVSYLFRANYTLMKRYILTFTYRRDGSSKFSQHNRFGDFPSGAIGWNISQEKFMENIKFLSKLKLRASYGVIGNDKIPYLSRFSQINSVIVTILGTASNINPAASFGPIGNDNLKWENTSQLDIGVETGFFKDKLTGEFDFFDKETTGILVALAIPAYFGNGLNTLEFFNAAKVRNRGFEFNLGWRDNIAKVKYNVSVNGTVLDNKVLSIGGVSGSDTVLYGGLLDNGQRVTASRVGLPVGAFYGYKTDGIFQTQAELNAYPHITGASGATVGSLRYVDINGDGKIDDRDRTYLGSPIPKFTFGLSLGLEYLGMDLSVDFQGQTGNKIFNAKEIVRPDQYNYEGHVLGAWTGPGTSNSEPFPSSGGYNYLPNDHFVYDGSFIRIRSLIFGYTIPLKITSKAYIQKLRVYVKGDNLITWTKYTGYTPEIGSTNVLNNGVDYGAYPTTTVYSFGLNLNF